MVAKIKFWLLQRSMSITKASLSVMILKSILKCMVLENIYHNLLHVLRAGAKLCEKNLQAFFWDKNFIFLNLGAWNYGISFSWHFFGTENASIKHLYKNKQIEGGHVRVAVFSLIWTGQRFLASSAYLFCIPFAFHSIRSARTPELHWPCNRLISASYYMP